MWKKISRERETGGGRWRGKSKRQKKRQAGGKEGGGLEAEHPWTRESLKLYRSNSVTFLLFVALFVSVLKPVHF